MWSEWSKCDTQKRNWGTCPTIKARMLLSDTAVVSLESTEYILVFKVQSSRQGSISYESKGSAFSGVP